MGDIVLESQLHIPVQQRDLVARSRLRAALEGGISGYRLVVVTAPAGYGKTTLLADWARHASLPVAWLSLSAEEDDAVRFLRYLLAAWEMAQPGIVETPLGILLGSHRPELKAVLAAFLSAAERAPEPLAFVIDETHVITDAGIHEALTFLLDRLPPHLHFILSGRSQPPLPLARYRARGQLLELQAGELHFTLQESADFLSLSLGSRLSPAEVSALHAATEGWVAGLKLAALALRRRPLEAKGLPPVSGEQRFIADYLAEDVLDRLPADLQAFLLKTGLLDRLCGPLCDALTRDPGGQARLELLERENLFIVPLDDRREWFRYHSLFAEFLQAELKHRLPEEVTGLHRLAAAWFADHELPEPAFRHALAGEDPELVIRIAMRDLPLKLLGSEFKAAARWLEAIPEAWYAAYPQLGVGRAAYLLQTGELEAALRDLDEVERALAQSRSAEARRAKAWAAGARCGIACLQNNLDAAEVLAEQALRDLPAEDIFLHAMIHIALGDTYRRNGFWEESRANYLELLNYAHHPTFRYLGVHVYGALADLALRQGELRRAAGWWQKALAVIQDQASWGSLPLPLTGWVYLRLSEILYEWNQLVQAWAHVGPGMERAGLGGDVQATIAGCLIAGRLKLTEGDLPAAEAFLERARPLLEQAPFQAWTGRFERLRLETWLAQGRPAAAGDWAAGMLAGEKLAAHPDGETARLSVARALIVQSSPQSLNRAQRLLEQLIETARSEGRTGVLIEALALVALAGWSRGDRPAALAALERALRLAEPEGYTRLFADLGLPMGRLLQEARSRGVRPATVERLLAAFAPDLRRPTPGPAALTEPLTRREQEVLELIAAGLTNREIAGQLVVSPETVKTHTANLYGKLGASNRTQAVARARQLELLR